MVLTLTYFNLFFCKQKLFAFIFCLFFDIFNSLKIFCILLFFVVVVALLHFIYQIFDILFRFFVFEPHSDKHNNYGIFKRLRVMLIMLSTYDRRGQPSSTNHRSARRFLPSENLWKPLFPKVASLKKTLKTFVRKVEFLKNFVKPLLRRFD